MAGHEASSQIDLDTRGRCRVNGTPWRVLDRRGSPASICGARNGPSVLLGRPLPLIPVPAPFCFPLFFFTHTNTLDPRQQLMLPVGLRPYKSVYATMTRIVAESIHSHRLGAETTAWYCCHVHSRTVSRSLFVCSQDGLHLLL